MKLLLDQLKTTNSLYTFLFVCIILLASFLRLYQLGSVPNGFQGDEAAFGYNAYSLLTTGTDEYGAHFPLVLRSFNDYKPALYAYTDIPFITIFGLTEFATRLPSALFGIFSVIITYYVAKKLFNNSSIGLLSSFLLAISPWQLNLSRTTSETIGCQFFILILVYSLLKIKERFSLIWLISAVASGFLSFGFYMAGLFFVILTAVVFFIFSIKIVNNKPKINKTLFSVCVCLFAVAVFYNHITSITRFTQVNIFSNPGTTLTLEEQIREDQFTSPMETRFFHNKIVNYTGTILQNYSEYFTLDFLALNGGYPKRQRIPNAGEFYLWQIPFLLIGVYFIFRKNILYGKFIFTLWLTLLLPAAITYDEIPNVYRTLVVVPFMTIIIATGIYYFFREINNKKLWVIGIICLFIAGLYNFLYYQHEYFVHQDIHQPWYRNYPMKELSLSLQKYYPQFSTIILTKEEDMSYIHLLFFGKISPLIYQQSGSHLDKTDTGFGKYLFTYKECPFVLNNNPHDQKPSPNILYVDAGTCKIPNISEAKLLQTIYWGDHTPAFKLVQYIPTK